ncbi:hypothetical protein STXM2123_4702 [Streptomyces sp. F-3]|nr:hypothetical protein STXM2123_4702 [Streptomyces sp. F-3]
MALGERVRHGLLGLAAQRVHTRVQSVDEFLLLPQFTVGEIGV